MGSFRNLIDAFMAEKKVMVGDAQWNKGPRFETEGQRRSLQTLAINGEICPVKMVIDEYPSHVGLKFSIALVCEVEVVRLDYGKISWHVNHHPLPEGVPFGRIDGPHIHSWPLNRSLFSSNLFPDALYWAVPIPQNLKSFSNTFRWMCGEHNVECEKEIPELRGDLLL